MVAGGCVFVDDADEVWKASDVDEALVGSWSGTNIFTSIKIENCGDYLKLGVVQKIPRNETRVHNTHISNEPIGQYTNIFARVTDIFGIKVLIVKDVREVIMGQFCEMSKEPEGKHPSPYVHDYMLVPYRINEGILTFSVAEKNDLTTWIGNEELEAFLSMPPPARDFSPPVLARLDKKTVTALKVRYADGVFWRQNVYKKIP